MVRELGITRKIMSSLLLSVDVPAVIQPAGKPRGVKNAGDAETRITAYRQMQVQAPVNEKKAVTAFFASEEPPEKGVEFSMRGKTRSAFASIPASA